MTALSALLKKFKLRNNKLHNNLICNAPFNTLFFSMTGEIYFCLKNKEQLLGKYPQNSIKEIIEGETITKLRTSFLKNNVMPGCEYCQEQISMGNHDSAFNQYSNISTIKNKVTIMEFELSNKCNLACVMCSAKYSSKIESAKPTIDIPYNEAFFEQLKPYLPDLVKASFRGGEPFLIPIYYKIWDYLLQHNPKVKIFITTNGTVFSPKIERYLLTKQFIISLSVDSFEKETFSKIRANGNFQKFSKNLNQYIELLNKKAINLSFCTCIMTENWAEIPTIFNFCHTNKISIHLNFVEGPSSLSLKYLSKNKLTEIIVFFKENIKSNDYNTTIYQSIITTLENWKNNQNFNDAIKKHSKISNMLEVKKIHKPNMILQKEIFFNTLHKQIPEELFINIKKNLLNNEKHFQINEDIEYFYILLNHLPMNFITDSIINKKIEDFSEIMKDFIEISKQKFIIYD